VIEGERVYLRAIEPGDLDACHRWINDREITRHLAIPPWPVSRLAEQAWLESRARGGTDTDHTLAVCLKNGDRHIGNVGLHGVNWRHRTANVGILIGEKDCWDQGLGAEAVGLLCRFAFRNLGLRKISLCVFSSNPRARRCYEKCGFQVEGVLPQEYLIDGEYVDDIRMALFAPGEGPGGPQA
jgi:RimJ/RimL family protein N-acetyltransferase